MDKNKKETLTAFLIAFLIVILLSAYGFVKINQMIDQEEAEEMKEIE